MEANRKRRGFMKSKLVKPFYRSAKPSSASPTTVLPHINTAATKIKSSAPSAGAIDFYVKQYDYVTPAHPKQIISFAPPDNGYDSYARLEKIYGVVADESVDLKAATYISRVQEGFKLERVNSERKDASQDIH